MKIYIKHTITLGLLIILAIANLQAQNIHVAIDGSNSSGNGSINNPYATITKASQQISVGDTVFVHAGTYHNENFGDGDIWKIEDLATIICHGAENAYIVFMPFPGDEVLLEYDSRRGVIIKNSSYVKFIGFHVKGPGENITLEETQAAWGLYKDEGGNIHDLAVEMGIDITDPDLWGQTLDKPVTPNIKKPSYFNGIGLMDFLSHHIIMENNTVSWATASGMRVQKSDYTIVKGNTIINNTLRTSAGVGALTVAEARVLPEGDGYDDIKIELINNEIHHNENQIYSWAPSKSFIHFVIDEGSGIFLTRNNDTYDHGYILIANNLSYNNGASGIVVHKTDRAIVEHNTVYNNGTTNGENTKPGGMGFNTTNHVTFRNNISWSKPNKFALGKVGGTNNDLTIDSNLLFNNYGPQSVVKGVTSGWFEANPEFLDIDAFDFHLHTYSPAINRGITSAISTEDITGFPRSDGQPDIGAYEFDPLSNQSFTDKKSKDLYAYPNPTKGIVSINIDKEELKTLRVFNLLGKEQNIKVNQSGFNKAELDISMLTKGIYLVKTKHTFIKIIKH